jgi:hypothetical protein
VTRASSRRSSPATSGFDPSTPPGLTLPREEDLPRDGGEIERSGIFGRLLIERVGWEQTYTTKEYLGSLMTYSGHRALQRDARESLLDCISGLIDGKFGGRITKRYLFELAMAPRIASTGPGRASLEAPVE